MPTANLILMLLIGIVFGGIASVILKGRGIVFIVNILLGIIGASLGAFFPVLIGQVEQRMYCLKLHTVLIFKNLKLGQDIFTSGRKH